LAYIAVQLWLIERWSAARALLSPQNAASIPTAATKAASLEKTQRIHPPLEINAVLLQKGLGMKILLLSTSFPRRRGDHMGHFVFELAKGLARNRCELTVVAPHADGLAVNDEFDRIRVRRFRYFFPAVLEQVAYGFGIPENLRQKIWAKIGLPFFLLGFFIAALREARGAKLIHVHWEIAGLVGVALGRIFRIPVVMTVHRLVARGKINRAVTQFLLKNVNDLHFNSSYTLAEARALAGHDLRGPIIHPSIDPLVHHPGEATGALAKRLQFPPHLPVILSVGRLIEKKGTVYLLEAFAELSSRSVLVIVGSGPLLGELRSRAERISSRIFFMEEVTPAEVPDILRAATVFAFPSIQDEKGEVETLGVAAIEALACGIPVVASDIGGIPDVIEHEKTGLLVPPANVRALTVALSQVLGDPALRERLSQAGVLRAHERFTWDRAVLQTLDAYKGLLA
jgi:glycosyltransferase involved in cell wall biosynthesis